MATAATPYEQGYKAGFGGEGYESNKSAAWYFGFDDGMYDAKYGKIWENFNPPVDKTKTPSV